MEFYRTMVRIRTFEEKAAECFTKGMLAGNIHLSIGQEAAEAGAFAAIEPKDYFTSTHRGHGHAIARGADPKRAMAELFGKKTGYCKGKGGSMHIADMEKMNHLGANGIVGGGQPISAGSALASWILGDDSVTVGCFGDGERLPFIREVTRACRDAGVRYWGNVESGELPVASVDAFAERYGAGGDVNDRRIRPDWRAVPLPKLERKLELAARDAEKIMSWGYMEFFRPGGGAENRRNYQAYCSYRDSVRGVEVESASSELLAAGSVRKTAFYNRN